MNIGLSEIIVIFLVALLLFGPEQLPQMARQLGQLMAQVRKGTNAIRREWYNAVYPPAEEIRRDFASQATQLRTLTSEVLQPPTQHSQPSGSEATAGSVSIPRDAPADPDTRL